MAKPKPGSMGFAQNYYSRLFMEHRDAGGMGIAGHFGTPLWENLRIRKPQRFADMHSAHFKALGKKPFFRWLLQKKQEYSINVGGQALKFSVCLNGFNCERPLVFAIDEYGKTLCFYKSSGDSSGKAGQWFPTHGLARERVTGRTIRNAPFVDNPGWRKKHVERLANDKDFKRFGINVEDQYDDAIAKIPLDFRTNRFKYRFKKFEGHPEITKISPAVAQVCALIAELEREGKLKFRDLEPEELRKSMGMLSGIDIREEDRREDRIERQNSGKGA